MKVTIHPQPLSGRLAAIPAKADAHRKLIAAALANAPSALKLGAGSADITATIACLTALGAHITATADGQHIVPLAAVSAQPLLDCNESGSTLRFLLPVAAALADGARFTGAGRLPARPLDHLLDCLAAHGVTTDAPRLPFQLQGRLQAGRYQLPGHISSQYVSGLLFALPLLDAASTIELTTPLQSAGYVQITLRVLRGFGIVIEELANGYRIPGGQRYHTPGALVTEGDWSNAAFFLAAGALHGTLTLTGLDADSAQPDRAIAALLAGFGAQVAQTGNQLTVHPAALSGQEIDVAETPDLLPILAVLGALAAGETRLVNAARLRLKESDRLQTTAALLNNLGATVAEGPDYLAIQGQRQLRGGTLESFGDHRIAMAAAIAASRATGPVTIEGAQAVNKSYPGFYDDYQRLGGLVDVDHAS